jgi:sphinganine-1-phosphate aldolase
MHYMGEECVIRHQYCLTSHVAPRGYIASCRDIVGAAKAIEEAIQNSFPELYVLGKPPASVVAFGSRTPSLNILEVGDKMSKKGWHLNALQNPPGLHIACTVRTCV